MVVLSSEKWNELKQSKEGASSSTSASMSNTNFEEVLKIEPDFKDQVVKKAIQHYIKLINHIKSTKIAVKENYDNVWNRMNTDFNNFLYHYQSEWKKTIDEYYQDQLYKLIHAECGVRQRIEDLLSRNEISEKWINEPKLTIEMPSLISLHKNLYSDDMIKLLKCENMSGEESGVKKTFHDMCWDENNYSKSEILSDPELFKYYVTSKNFSGASNIFGHDLPKGNPSSSSNDDEQLLCDEMHQCKLGKLRRNDGAIFKSSDLLKDDFNMFTDKIQDSCWLRNSSNETSEETNCWKQYLTKDEDISQWLCSSNTVDDGPSFSLTGYATQDEDISKWLVTEDTKMQLDEIDEEVNPILRQFNERFSESFQPAQNADDHENSFEFIETEQSNDYTIWLHQDSSSCK